MNNKKGMTLVEIIASIVIISIVMIFMTRLFISVNALYQSRKLAIQYQTIQNLIIDAIGKDYKKYNGIKGVEINDTGTYLSSETTTLTGIEKVKIVFNDYREGKTDNITKELYIQQNHTSSKYYIYYKHEQGNLTSEESAENIIRVMPEYIKLNSSPNYLQYTYANNILEIKIPMKNKNLDNYDINIYLKY